MNFFLSILTGILLFLSFPKFNLSFLAWIALVPLLIAVQNTTSKKAFLLGLLSGIVFYCGYLYWLIPTFTAAGESWFLGLLTLLLLSIYLSLYIALFCFFFNLFTIPYTLAPSPCLLFSAPLWTLLEFIKGRLFSGIPAGIIGYSQWNFLPIIQISDITGVYGVSFLIVLVNITIYQLTTIQNLKLKIKNVVFCFFVFLICFFYGIFKLTTSDSRLTTHVRIAVLQGNIDQYKKWDQKYKNEIINTYTKLATAISKNDKPNLIIWPESAIPGYLLEDKFLSDWIYNLARKTKTYHLLGSADFSNNKYYNSALLISSEGKLIDRYDKIHLVPFGETVPLKSFLSKYIKVLNDLGDFTTGEKFTVFHLPLPPKAGQPKADTTCPYPLIFSSNICFESIFPELIRNFKGQEFIINITNDAWYLRTSAPYQHFSFNIFRAVENRKPVIRCANTGISGYIDSTGRIISKTAIFTTSAQIYTIQPNQKTTFYSRFGNVFIILCGLTVFLNLNILLMPLFMKK